MGGASPGDRPEPRLASQGLAWSRAPAPPAGGAERGQGDPGRRRQPLQGPRGWLKAKSLVAVGTHRIRTGERLPKKWQQRGLTYLAPTQLCPDDATSGSPGCSAAQMAAMATSAAAGTPPCRAAAGHRAQFGPRPRPALGGAASAPPGGGGPTQSGARSALGSSLDLPAPLWGIRTLLFVATPFIIGLWPITG